MRHLLVVLMLAGLLSAVAAKAGDDPSPPLVRLSGSMDSMSVHVDGNVRLDVDLNLRSPPKTARDQRAWISEFWTSFAEHGFLGAAWDFLKHWWSWLVGGAAVARLLSWWRTHRIMI